jgi:hypothetical protein
MVDRALQLLQIMEVAVEEQPLLAQMEHLQEDVVEQEQQQILQVHQ